MRRRVPAVATVLVALLGVAACSSSSNGKPATATSNPVGSTPVGASTAATSPSSFPSSSAPAASPSSAETVTKAQIQSVLLTAKDISANAIAQAIPTTSNNPLPCQSAGEPTLTDKFPGTVRAGVDIVDNTARAAVSEEIRLFADKATATAALAYAKAGLACSGGTVTADDGTKLAVKLGAPQDIEASLLKDAKLASTGIDQAYAWSATSSTDDYGLVTVQIDRSLVLMTFVNAAGADTSKLPDPLSIVELAIEKGN
ncbi:hypothetical protein [Jatrophihabitans sp.]|uniref:hypothetical protein n=1 Tax=Jatrophihabitans sp. TaxID=1932789 RepID=UPI0030C729E9|nr:hypothetical protein [Jatrophihabitans sp.]